MEKAKELKFFKNRYLIHELVRKSVKTQYRSSWLGMIWTILNPLLNMLVMWAVFTQFFGRNDPYYPVYLITGNVLFASLRSATDGGLGSVVANRGLLTRMKIEPHLFPLASVLSSLVNFFFSLIAVFAIMIIVMITKDVQLFNVRMLCVLLMLPAFVLFEYGIALFLSAIYVYARDIKYLYSVFLALWMYMTPIFYKFDTLQAGSFSASVVKMNPMYYFVRFFRDAMYMGWSEYPVQDCAFLYLLGFISLAIGIVTFNLLKKNFMRNI